MKKITLKMAFIATILGLSTFSAMATAPQVDSVATVSGITRTTAFSGCYVINTATPKTNPDSIAERGVCINTAGTPVITDTKFASYKSIAGVQYEPCVLSGLTANTHYYIRAYATNVGGETSYSAQKEFTTSANDVEAIWTLKSNLTAAISGSITATDLDYSKVCTTVGYDQNSGGNGTTTILFPAPTGLLKETVGLMTLATFDTNIYFAFSVTPANQTSINKLAFNAFGYKTGSMKVKIEYSLDNFATAGILLTNATLNDAVKTQITNGEINFPSANPSLTTLMGKENVSWPANINVNVGQTVSFRMYLWGKAGSGILMKNLIVSGTTDLGTGFNLQNSTDGQLKLISTKNEIKIENATNIQQLDVLSVNGKMLRSFKNSKPEIQLSTNDLQSGVYIVKAYTVNGIQTGKFLK